MVSRLLRYVALPFLRLHSASAADFNLQGPPIRDPLVGSFLGVLLIAGEGPLVPKRQGTGQ